MVLFSGQFQSLFCWMLFQKPYLDLNIPLQEFCFNPYSVGCYFRSVVLVKHDSLFIPFQSLFCWMLFQKLNQQELIMLLWLVSILILLDVISEAIHGILAVGCYPVSILILLDVISEVPMWQGCRKE